MNPVGAPTAMFGNPAIGTASEAAGAGYKFGSTYALSQNGTAQSFSFYTRGGESFSALPLSSTGSTLTGCRPPWWPRAPR